MRPGKYNFLCPQGTTFNKRLSYQINSIPVDLTGYTARMQVREKAASSTKILDLTTENGGLVINEGDGTVTINVAASVTSEIFPKNYVYDLEIVSNEDEVTRLIEGGFNVTAEVTR